MAAIIQNLGYWTCNRCGWRYGSVLDRTHFCVCDLPIRSELLVVGCGLRPRPGAINLDCIALPGVDIIWDLDDHRALPFPDETFARIECEDVLEHVENPIDVVERLGRILRVGGVLWIRGPDGRYPEIVWADLTHKRAFAPRSFDGFDPETHDGRLYGHYHGLIKFKVGPVVEKNKGLEFTLEKRSIRWATEFT